jgi:hypothetical protein
MTDCGIENTTAGLSLPGKLYYTIEIGLDMYALLAKKYCHTGELLEDNLMKYDPSFHF